MNIEEIDKNFITPSKFERDDIIWLDAGSKPFELYGATSSNPYTRMDYNTAVQVSKDVGALSTFTAGIRIRFKTDSPFIAIHCEWKYQTKMSHMTYLGICGFDLYAIPEGCTEQQFIRSFVPPVESTLGYESITDSYGGMTDYVLNFPLYNPVDKLYIGVEKNSKFETPATYVNSKPVVFYGSSITQGGCASHPGNSYQNYLSRMFNMDYVNLGFSGSGKAEDRIIEYMANLNMSVFVSDYDYNAPDLEHLKKTHYKLYHEIRKKHSEIPYIILSEPDYKFDSDSSNSRRSEVINTYQRAYMSGDKNVFFIDGSTMYAGPEWQSCSVDGVHPNDLGFYKIAQSLYPVFSYLLSSNNLTE